MYPYINGRLAKSDLAIRKCPRCPGWVRPVRAFRGRLIGRCDDCGMPSLRASASPDQRAIEALLMRTPQHAPLQHHPGGIVRLPQAI